MTLDQLDPTLNNPKRLAALGVVATSAEVEFVFLRDALTLSDSDLSKHMSTLVSAGYVTVRKTGKGRSRQTWYRVTRQGRSSLSRHIAALNALVNDAPRAPAAAVD